MKKLLFKPLLPYTVESGIAALKLFNNMREADCREMLLMGWNDISYITDSINSSRECFAAYTEEGILIGIGGIGGAPDFGLGVPVWFIASKDSYLPQAACTLRYGDN